MIKKHGGKQEIRTAFKVLTHDIYIWGSMWKEEVALLSIVFYELIIFNCIYPVVLFRSSLSCYIYIYVYITQSLVVPH